MSSNSCNYAGVETINRQTGTVLVVVKREASPCLRAWPTAYRLHVRPSLCSTSASEVAVCDLRRYTGIICLCLCQPSAVDCCSGFGCGRRLHVRRNSAGTIDTGPTSRWRRWSSETGASSRRITTSSRKAAASQRRCATGPKLSCPPTSWTSSSRSDTR